MSSTIKDVAQKAGVSIATVSLVIHDHKRISDETKKKVIDAIKDLNYHPSHSARGLVSKKSGNIGFLLTEDHFLRSEPFYTNIFLGTEFEARQSENYILLTTISSDFSETDKLPRFVLEGNVDGIIVAGKVPESLILQLDLYGIPLVFVDYLPSVEDKYSLVLIDNIAGGSMAVRHLIERGHKNIGFIGGDIRHPSIYERFHGYKFALDQAGLSYDDSNYCIDEDYPNRECGYSAAKKLLDKNKNITAIFTCNDAMAIGVMQYLKENKIRIPNDIALIGFDNVDSCQTMETSLTSIAVPKLEMGIESFKLMTEILNNKIKINKKVLMPVELVKRSST